MSGVAGGADSREAHQTGRAGRSCTRRAAWTGTWGTGRTASSRPPGSSRGGRAGERAAVAHGGEATRLHQVGQELHHLELGEVAPPPQVARPDLASGARQAPSQRARTGMLWSSPHTPWGPSPTGWPSGNRCTSRRAARGGAWQPLVGDRPAQGEGGAGRTTNELSAAEKYASPPGAVYVIIHQMKLMVAWWYTCSTDTCARVSARQSGCGCDAGWRWGHPHLLHVALEQHDEGVHELVDLGHEEYVDHPRQLRLPGRVGDSPQLVPRGQGAAGHPGGQSVRQFQRSDTGLQHSRPGRSCVALAVGSSSLPPLRRVAHTRRTCTATASPGRRCVRAPGGAATGGPPA